MTCCTGQIQSQGQTQIQIQVRRDQGQTQAQNQAQFQTWIQIQGLLTMKPFIRRSRRRVTSNEGWRRWKINQPD